MTSIRTPLQNSTPHGDESDRISGGFDRGPRLLDAADATHFHPYASHGLVILRLRSSLSQHCPRGRRFVASYLHRQHYQIIISRPHSFERQPLNDWNASAK